MLRVTIELVPFGDEEEASRIATMLIGNDGTGDRKHGSYAYAYNYSDRPDDPVSGTITRFPRSQGAWALIKKILGDKYLANNDLADYLVERLADYKDEE